MFILILLIVAIVVYAIYNLINYLRFDSIQKYLILAYSSEYSDVQIAQSHKIQIVTYIKHSGVKDKYIPIVQNMGYGQLVASSVSIFDNILDSRQDIAKLALQSLNEAKGNYWFKFINSFNPLYWLRIILFIPKYLLSYLGLNKDSTVIKVFQVIYWLISIICTFTITIFSDEIKTFIISKLNTV